MSDGDDTAAGLKVEAERLKATAERLGTVAPQAQKAAEG